MIKPPPGFHPRREQIWALEITLESRVQIVSEKSGVSCDSHLCHPWHLERGEMGETTMWVSQGKDWAWPGQAELLSL